MTSGHSPGSAPSPAAGGPHGPLQAVHRSHGLGGTTADRNIVIFGLGMLLCAVLLALVPDLGPAPTGLVSDRVHGQIAALLTSSDQVAPKATVTLLGGDTRGQTVTADLESPSSQILRPDYRPGDEVLVAVDTQPDGTVAYSVIDRWRLPVLAWLTGAFALVTIAIAGWRGLRALTSLAITVVVVVRLLIPLLLAGYSAIGLAVGLGVVITVLSFLLTQGLSRATWAAIAGTALGLLVTGVLAVVVTEAARFTAAQGSEEVVVLGQLAGGAIDLSGLLLAAVIFGGLGVLNDVAITQAVTVAEFRSVDPSMSPRELYRRTMSVGIAHLAATVNTLVFAYLGSALPVIVLLALQAHRLDLAINDEHIAVEVVRTVVGAIGVLSAVPFTTAIAAWWMHRPERVRGRRPRRLMAVPRIGLPSAHRTGPEVPTPDVGEDAGPGVADMERPSAPEPEPRTEPAATDLSATPSRRTPPVTRRASGTDRPGTKRRAAGHPAAGHPAAGHPAAGHPGPGETSEPERPAAVDRTEGQVKPRPRNRRSGRAASPPTDSSTR
jgi:uncharacterized membrane protein